MNQLLKKADNILSTFQNYIDERERNMLVVKEQFIAELEAQGRQLQQLVEDMMTCREMKEDGEEYCRKGKKNPTLRDYLLRLLS